MKSKKELRQEIKEVLAAMKVEERNDKAKKIHDHLFQLPQWNEAKMIGVTISVGNEIDTYAIIERAWAEGKEVAVPRCLPASKELVFYTMTSFSDIEDSFYGLKEPNPERTTVIEPSEIDFLLVPGLLYDRHGYRIGYGGGYYDRFLAKVNPYTCVLAYSEQLMNQALPYEEFDVPVNMIMTDQEVLII